MNAKNTWLPLLTFEKKPSNPASISLWSKGGWQSMLVTLDFFSLFFARPKNTGMGLTANQNITHSIIPGGANNICTTNVDIKSIIIDGSSATLKKSWFTTNKLRATTGNNGS